jgi:hypothetical protein
MLLADKISGSSGGGGSGGVGSSFGGAHVGDGGGAADVSGKPWVRKAPVMKRPAARAAEATSHKRPRDDDAWDPAPPGDAGGGDDVGVVAGGGERESKDGREVFVGDLPDNCTIEAVASALYRFGNVNSVRVMDARNFGFVTFADREGATKAIEAGRCRLTL